MNKWIIALVALVALRVCGVVDVLPENEVIR